MDNPFGDNLSEQFVIYDQFFATEVPCPWCGTAYTLDVQEGSYCQMLCSGGIFQATISV